MKEKRIRLKSFVIDSKTLETRFNLELPEDEWTVLEHYLQNSWKNLEFDLERVLTTHLRNSLQEMGYKPVLQDGKLTLVKKDNE